MSTAMTKAERTDLARFIRRREKVAKTAAAQRTAELKADVERQLSAIYSPDDDALWAKLMAEAETAVEKVQEDLAARCRELNIPDRFAPKFHFGWVGRRWEAADPERRTELRRLAYARIEAMELAAVARIERDSVELEGRVIANGLTSDAARDFLARLPGVEELMPALQQSDIKGLLTRQQ